MKKPDFLKKVKKVHLVGIKGVAMTALACCLRDLGIDVAGSDVGEVFTTDEVLRAKKIRIRPGFSEKNLGKNIDLVITTSAHGGLKNPEVLAAGKKGVSVLTHAEALGRLMEGKKGVSVCGVGGKTTVSAMLATVLAAAKRRPSFAVGVAEIDPLGWPGRYDRGPEFVAEADEYANSAGTDQRPRFIFQNPQAIVVTNIEYDHPDVYENLDRTKEAFGAFFEKLPRDGLLVANLDNENVRAVLAGVARPVQTFGFSPRADWRVEKVYFGQEQTIFNLIFQGGLIDQIKIRVPGRFNVLNAAAVFAVSTFLGVGAEEVKKGIWEFGGTKRRFEAVGEVRGVRLFDDYAHHPEEIKATLAAAKLWFPGQRLIVIFQPHTFSRTKALFKEFSHAFGGADETVITEIYSSAREKDDLGLSGRLLALEVKKNHSKVRFCPGQKEVAEFLGETARKGDVILTMGAGDVFRWHREIKKAIRESKT